MVLVHKLRREQVARYLMSFGWILLSFAVIALGVETFVCARVVGDSVGYDYRVIPVIPWLPAVAPLALVLGVFLAACGVGLLHKGRRNALFRQGIERHDQAVVGRAVWMSQDTVLRDAGDGSSALGLSLSRALSIGSTFGRLFCLRT
jgi:hypothetical protein